MTAKYRRSSSSSGSLRTHVRGIAAFLDLLGLSCQKGDFDWG
ncbi:hypothetical protein [Agathobaculum hominis]